VLIGELLNTITTFVLSMLFSPSISAAESMLRSFHSYWLGRWGSQYSNNRDPKEVSVVFYLGIYALIVVGMVAFYTTGLVTFYLSAVSASRYLHSKLVTSVL